MSKCPLCGRPVTVRPSGTVLHNHSGRVECDVLPEDRNYDTRDLVSSITGVTEN